MQKKLHLISHKFIEQYSKESPVDWLKVYNQLRSKIDFSIQDFEFYIAASSVYSSKIEGNSLDLNSFMRNRKTRSSQKEIKEIEDLVKAYRFASKHKITLPNLFEAHGILSKTLLPLKERGKIRKHKVGVYDSYSGKPVYLAVEPEFVTTELNKLFADIRLLLAKDLAYKEVFYFASMIHLWVALIHPFSDGNGRTARLLEKWFIAVKIGLSAWSINSEKYYWDNRPDYYKNIALGYNYYALNWDKCVPFLLMFPSVLLEINSH